MAYDLELVRIMRLTEKEGSVESISDRRQFCIPWIRVYFTAIPHIHALPEAANHFLCYSMAPKNKHALCIRIDQTHSHKNPGSPTKIHKKIVVYSLLILIG
jgi:hypothetical protein